MNTPNLPPGVGEEDQVIMVDAECKLCNGWSRFIMRYDRRRVFKICSVQSEAGRAILRWFGLPVDYFETMLLIQGGSMRTKSDAFIAVMRQMPWPWKLLRGFGMVPRPLRDWVYDRIARNRYKLFGKFDECIMPRPDHEKRFL